MNNIKKDDLIEVEITDVTNKGSGIGKVRGLVIFVEKALYGQIVKARITKVKKSYALGKIEFIVKESPFKKPKDEVCPYLYEGCGGCTLGELTYEAQIEIKCSQLRNKLERIGGIENPIIKPMIEGENKENYRNKGVISVSGNKIGFLKGESKEVIDCEYCRIQREEINATVKGLRHYLKENPKDKGLIEKIMIRVGKAQQVLVGIKGEINKLSSIQNMADFIYDEVNLVSLYEIKDKGDRLLAGSRTLISSIGQVEYEISPQSFFQVNDEQVVKLYDKAMEYAGLTGEETLVDIYCGVGTIGLYGIDKAKYVVGIEENKGAIINANRNAVINKRVNVRYFVGKAEEVLPKLLNKEIPDFDIDVSNGIALIDPPRGGCHDELLQSLGKWKPDRIVYISCDPATLARDIKVLKAWGYIFEEATPIDMFPQCGNIETVALLSQRR